MSQIKVPSSIETAVHKLASVDSLVTAKEWERAAIVAAFTQPSKGGRGNLTSSGEVLSVIEFARLGISGLRSQDSVRRYRNAWLTTGRISAPGATVDLDGLEDFPPHEEAVALHRRQALDEAAEAEGAGIRSTRQVATHLPALRAAIKADPKVAAAASEALDERWEAALAARPIKPEAKTDNARTEHIDSLNLMVSLRRAHKAMAEIVVLAQNIRGLGADDLAEGVRYEIEYIRGACDVIETGLNGGPLDAQLQELLDTEAGR